MFKFLKNRKDISKTEKQSIDIVKEMYQNMNAEGREKIFYGGYQEAHEILISICRVLQKGVNYDISQRLFLSRDIYVQVWIRKRGGFSPEFMETENIKRALKNKFGFIDNNVLSDIVDMCVQIIYINEPEIKQRDSITKCIKNMHLENAQENEGIGNLYIDDDEYGLVMNKPVFVTGYGYDKVYLNSLITDLGDEITYQRRGSCPVDGIQGPVDIYDIYIKDGIKYGEIYICIYGKTMSTRVPKGYKFIKA